MVGLLQKGKFVPIFFFILMAFSGEALVVCVHCWVPGAAQALEEKRILNQQGYLCWLELRERFMAGVASASTRQMPNTQMGRGVSVRNWLPTLVNYLHLLHGT